MNSCEGCVLDPVALSDSSLHDCQGRSYRSRAEVARSLGLIAPTEKTVRYKTGKAPSAGSRAALPPTKRRHALSSQELQAREVVAAASQLLPEGIVPQHGRGNLAWECQVCGQVGMAPYWQGGPRLGVPSMWTGGDGALFTYLSHILVGWESERLQCLQ